MARSGLGGGAPWPDVVLGGCDGGGDIVCGSSCIPDLQLKRVKRTKPKTQELVPFYGVRNKHFLSMCNKGSTSKFQRAFHRSFDVASPGHFNSVKPFRWCKRSVLPENDGIRVFFSDCIP